MVNYIPNRTYRIWGENRKNGNRMTLSLPYLNLTQPPICDIIYQMQNASRF